MRPADGCAVCWRGRTYNVVVVALAAKLARIAWATLRKGVSFERRPEPALA